MLNIIRDPMWGRNSEAYSECPFLTGEFAAAVIHGMRSDERGEGKFIQAFGGTLKLNRFCPQQSFSANFAAISFELTCELLH